MADNKTENCDGAMWYIETKMTGHEVIQEVATTIYNYEDRKVEPTEIGYKYHILTYTDKTSEVDVYSAYIGDVSHFIRNNSKAGCNGLIVKDGVMEKKYIENMFKKILENLNFPQQTISDAVHLVR